MAKDFRALQKRDNHEMSHPGRTVGSVGGRMMALHTLDKMMSRAENQEKLLAALQKKFDRDPVDFFQNVVVPLLPKQRDIEMVSGEMATKTSRTPDQIVRNMDALTMGVKLPEEAQTVTYKRIRLSEVISI
jgi:hypothetical protein